MEFARAARLRGVIADVARALGLSHEHVRLVAHGRRTSSKVQTALLREMRRREKAIARKEAA
jgi:prophage antirepressor-like protein